MIKRTQLYRLSLVSLLVFGACGSKSEQHIEEEIIKPVKYGKVFLSGGDHSRSFTGTAKAGLESRLSFRTSGLLEEVKVKVGDRVKKGQLLASLDNKDLLLGYQQAKSALDNATVQRNNSQSTLQRTKQLYQANNVSLSDYEQAKAAYANANSQYESAKKSLDLQNSQLEYGKIISPVKGLVSSVAAEKNEVIQAGSPIFTIDAGDDMEMEVGIPEVYISKVKAGDEVSIRFSSLKDLAFNGKVSEVPFSAGNASIYPITLKVLEATKEVRPGMTAEVTFSFTDSNEKAGLFVPIKAVGEDNNGNFVYVIRKDGDGYKANKQTVVIGKMTNQGFELVSGLKDGDLVATAGLSVLYDQMNVSLLN